MPGGLAEVVVNPLPRERSRAQLHHLPAYALPEIAFVGRSNAGKSSALNTLSGMKSLARVSKTPGRTQLINVFEAEPQRWIVDLPGYGFAAAPGRVRDTWQPMIEGYLTQRSSLRVVFVLVDAEPLGIGKPILGTHHAP